MQKSAWGQEVSSTIPTHLLIAAQDHGGLVLGAYDGDRMVGVLFGITSVENGRVYHYSHITGVTSEYQRRGVGFKLKLAQRNYILNRGQELIKWTYDPLQSGNAYFNIGKLGATCRTYRRNLYGPLDDSLNRGRLTDRFEVEWHLKTQRVRERTRGNTARKSPATLLAEGAEPANTTVETTTGVRKPRSARLGLKAPRLLVEIPESIVKIRDRSLRAANTWTMHVRRIFENYFERGYAVTDLAIDDDEARVFYVLESHFSY